MDKYNQMEKWESQYRLEHPQLENGYNKADILEWLAEKVVNKNLVLADVSGTLPNNLILYRQAKKLDYAEFCKWLNAKLGNLR